VRSIFPSATIIRPATLWGSQDEFLRHHATMMRYWPVYPLIYPDRKLQPVYVDDVAKGILHSLTTENARGAIYEFAGPTVITTKELVDWITKVLKFGEEVKQYPVNDDILWHLGYWFGQHRNPRFTPDSIKRSTDVVATGKYPGLASLGLAPGPLNSELALSILHMYRKPERFADITWDRAEIPDLGGNSPYEPPY